ncbi:MAG: hypothetical protein U1F52_07490 [Burkholderiales bacterium]
MKRVRGRTSILVVGLVAGCGALGVIGPKEVIAFDLDAIGADGLVGPATGRRAVDYEFCIPVGDGYADEVRTIDPSAQVMAGSRGRIGCRRGEVLVVGNTHQAGWRYTLERLATLRYVKRIVRTDFE